MQASERVLARRYAQALFETALAHREAEKAGEDLTAAFKALASKMDVYKHPMAGAARQKTALKNQIGTMVSARTLGLLELLIDKKRFNLLPLVVAEFTRLLDEHKGVVRAHVKSASDLSPRDVQTLTEKLKAFAGKDVVVDVKTAPELLGGVVVRLGDWVLDGSLQGRLKRLAAELAGAQ